MAIITSTIFLLILVSATTPFAITTPKCGDAFYTRTGTFSSPSYGTPSNSTNSGTELCEWRIIGGADEKIVLKITDIDIIKSPNCTQGFVEIRDGYWYSSPLIGRVCGSGSISPISATGNEMYVSYEYNNPNEHKGFIANYEAICGGFLFVENTTQFSTPSYPQQYPVNKKCIWRIVVPDNRSAVLTLDYFDLEDQSDCLYDYVEVRDGLTENSTLIGVYCGRNSVPTQIISNSRNLYVKFVSDMSVQRGGFLATVGNWHDACLSEDNDCAQMCINTPGSYQCACRPGYVLHDNGKDCINNAPIDTCGGVLNATSDTIRSPSSSEIGSPKTCTWDIVAEQDYLITINFTDFDVGTLNQYYLCDNDRLEIYDRNLTNDDLTLLAIYCGQELPYQITSPKNSLRVVYYSGASPQTTGFLLNYTTTVNFCSINNGNCASSCKNSKEGAICNCAHIVAENKRDCFSGQTQFALASSNGTIHTPNYPQNYNNYSHVSWTFRTTPGHRLTLTFFAFHLEADCSNDYVNIYNDRLVINKYERYCGSYIPPPFTSSSNEMKVVFSSNKDITYRGFVATYSSVCGGQLQAKDTKKYVYSHADYGYSNYENNVSCEWVIDADNGSFVSLSFSNFLLESNCQNDYVEILNGSGDDAVSVGKFCGSSKPPRIISTVNTVVVRFISNNDVSDRGFVFTYQALKNDTSV